MLLQRVVLFHLDFAFQDLCPARAAHAALAGVGQCKARFQADVQHADAHIRQPQLALLAVDDQLEIRGRRVVGDLDGRHARLRQRRTEALHVHLLGWHAGGLERGLGGVHHRAGTADEGFVDLGRGRERGQEGLALLLIQHAVEQLDFLQVVGQHVIQREPAHITVLEVFEFFGKHDRVDAAVAVHQREAARRFRLQCGLDDREHGRDAGAARERHIGP